jgi:hypothetical protein
LPPILDFLRKKKQLLTDSARSKAVDVLEWEISELENIFALLVFGSFVGFPSPPSSITLDLLPYMERDLHLMLDKVDLAAGPISDLFSHLDTP